MSQRPADRASVYVIGGPRRRNGRRSVKIGIAIDVNRRLSDLQMGSVEPLEMLATGPGGRTVEQRLHRRYEAQHVRGEWFELEPGQLRHLISAVSSGRLAETS